MLKYTWKTISTEGDETEYWVFTLEINSDFEKKYRVLRGFYKLPGIGKQIYSVDLRLRDISGVSAGRAGKDEVYILGNDKEDAKTNAVKYYQRYNWEHKEIYLIDIDDVVELDVINQKTTRYIPSRCDNCGELEGYGQTHITDTCGGFGSRYTCSSSLSEVTFEKYLHELRSRDW